MALKEEMKGCVFKSLRKEVAMLGEVRMDNRAVLDVEGCRLTIRGGGWRKRRR